MSFTPQPQLVRLRLLTNEFLRLPERHCRVEAGDPECIGLIQLRCSDLIKEVPPAHVLDQAYLIEVAEITTSFEGKLCLSRGAPRGARWLGRIG